MKKITLDFGEPAAAAALTKKEIHRYIACKLGFPEYYGCNLDALYDCLTDLAEPTAIGIVMPERYSCDVSSDITQYLLRVRKTFSDAEADNPNLAVFDLAERNRLENV